MAVIVVVICLFLEWELLLKVKRLKVLYSVNGTPSHSYGTSLAIWDHTVLPDTSERAPP